MNVVSSVAVLPIAVSDSGRGWVYLCGNRTGSEQRETEQGETEQRRVELSLLGGPVGQRGTVFDAVNFSLTHQAKGVFHDLGSRFVDSFRYPVSNDALRNENLTKMVSCCSNMGDVSAHVVKLYSGGELGEGKKNDLFIYNHRKRAKDTSDALYRVNPDELKEQMHGLGIENRLPIKAYGGNCSDMRQAVDGYLDQSARQILCNVDVMANLSQGLDELKQRHPYQSYSRDSNS